MSEKSCHSQNQPNALHIDDAGLDRDERAVLRVMRYYFQSFTQPKTQGWIMAFRSALMHFPHDQAPNIALAVLSVVQTMRMSRREVFRFSNPDCKTCRALLSEDERQLIGLVVAMRRGQRSRAHTHALLICEGNDTLPVLNAARDLSHLLARLGPARSDVASFAH